MSVLARQESVARQLRQLYGSFGYARYRMSKFEEYDLYVQNKSFLVSDHVITFTDTNGKLMALKPDVTLSIVRGKTGTATQKVCYQENVYRVSGGTGSYKELMQVGLECMGSIDTYCLAEVLNLAGKSLALISPDYVLDVSHQGILTCVVDELGLSGDDRRALLRCVGEKNLHGAQTVAKAAGAPEKAWQTLKSLMTCCGSAEKVLPQLKKLLPPQAMDMARQLEDVLAAVPGAQVDFSVVQDMNYYNGIVFKGFVEGIPAGVLSGGQYDRLMEKMGKASGAVGFAVYMDLLEDLPGEAPGLDVDTVLLYDEYVTAAAVAEKMDELTQNGNTAVALQAVPEKLRYARLVTMTGEEGILC